MWPHFVVLSCIHSLPSQLWEVQIPTPHSPGTMSEDWSSFSLLPPSYVTGSDSSRRRNLTSIAVWWTVEYTYYLAKSRYMLFKIHVCQPSWDLALKGFLGSHKMSVKNDIWDKFPECHPLSWLQEHSSFSNAAQWSQSNENRSPTMDQISGRHDLVCTSMKSIQLQLE